MDWSGLADAPRRKRLRGKAPHLDEGGFYAPSVALPTRALVISLHRRSDRRAQVSKMLSGRSTQMTLPWEFLEATDGETEPISSELVTTGWNTEKNVRYQIVRARRVGWDDSEYVPRDLALSCGERGCAHSHIRAWRQCVACHQPLLILEDDASATRGWVKKTFDAVSAVPRERPADLLYLGYSQAAPWRRMLAESGLAEAEYVWTTVAYIVWPRAAQLLLSKLPVNQPVDNWLAQLCADGELVAYCILPELITQGRWNANSDILHSDET